jgi:cellobiose phosphorylase
LTGSAKAKRPHRNVAGDLISQSSPNCYYSSSDAAFDDRYQASAEYERVARGAIPLDGGGRVYSSGPGIALGLIMRHFLGLSTEAAGVSIDPVVPPELSGLRVQTELLGRAIEVRYGVRGSGCGITSLVLNGEALPYTTRANPYRRGGAPSAAARSWTGCRQRETC